MTPYREAAPSGDVYSLVACRWIREARATGRAIRSWFCRMDAWICSGARVNWSWPDVDRTARSSRVAPGERILGLRLRPGSRGRAGDARQRGARHPPQAGRAARALGVGACRRASRKRDGDDEAFGLLEGIGAARSSGAAGRIRSSSPRPGASASRGAASIGWPNRSGSATASSGGAFTSAVGYGPKTLDRVLRFRRLVAQAGAVAAGESDLARLAADLGYADQAHMTRDCMRLSGCTPTQLAQLWTS